VSADALADAGLALHREGRLAEAADRYDQALLLCPGHWRALHLRGLVALQTQAPQLAVELISRAVQGNPESALAHAHLGNALLSCGQAAAALASYVRAGELQADDAELHYNWGNALFDLGRLDEALEHYAAAIVRQPDFAAAHRNRGLALMRQQRLEEAVAGFDALLALLPQDTEALVYRGDALRELGRYRESLASFDAAVARDDAGVAAHNGHGATLAKLREHAGALAAFDRALSQDPDFAAAHGNRANVLFDLRRWHDALAGYERALTLDPAFAEAHANRGEILRQLKRPAEALASYERAIAIRPGLAVAHLNRGEALRECGRFVDAIGSYDRAIAIQHGSGNALGMRRHAMMQVCDWRDHAADVARICERISRGDAVCAPFPLQALCDRPSIQRRAAEIFVAAQCPPDGRLGAIAGRPPGARIRIGYFSADLRLHPVSILMAEVFELHDRDRFEVTAFSFGQHTSDAMRARLEAAIEHFVDVRDRSDLEIAALARQRGIDIAVDLGGFTEDCRMGIFALRAAPLQVGYLGYLGTSGAPYMDYLVADATLVPAEQRRHYSEQLLYLPSYQANDRRRPIAQRLFTRAELGLPETGFVYCCLNTNYKITPPTFDSWMRILGRVPGSVLYLYAGNEVARANLVREALARGIGAQRLAFAPRLAGPEYLARYRVADLFLDTQPYNAGATASDALWAGLPVLTLAGESLAGRMAASLLQAAGLPELITASRVEYEDLAVRLAQEPGRLRALRARLQSGRERCALFAAERFTRSLEHAYAAIHARHVAGLPPADMTLPGPQ
jgi:predicted O-linked N-acetylglucosamine transferase (SPINDLY family)